MANIIEKAGDLVSSSSISREVLHDRLSEFLAVERGGLELYEEALRVISDREVSRRFREFRDQTSKHEAILLRVMNELGMDPTYMSAGAKLAQQKAASLLETIGNRNGGSAGLSSDVAEMNAIENIILAETKDHADWELLGKIARQSDDAQIRRVLKPAVSEVEPEEDEHLSWTKEQLARLEFQSLATRS
jgi:rubrerythrin